MKYRLYGTLLLRSSSNQKIDLMMISSWIVLILYTKKSSFYLARRFDWWSKGKTYMYYDLNFKIWIRLIQICSARCRGQIVYRFQMKHKNLIYGLVQEYRKTQKCRPIWCNTHKWYFFEFKFKQCVRCLLTTACFIMTTMRNVADESTGSLSESLTKRRFSI